jgi:hypothetical protein
VAGGEAPGRSHARDTGFGILVVEAAGLASGVNFDADVVYGAIARVKLERSNEAVFAEWSGDDEIAVKVAPLRGEKVGFWHFDDEVRRAELPAFGEMRLRREVARIALGSAGFGPGLEELDFGGVEVAFAEELTETMGRQPGRHVAG